MDRSRRAAEEALYREVRAHHLAPLWTRPKLTAKPKPTTVPTHWRYGVVRDLLLRSAEFVSHDDTDRRVLALESPGLEGTWSPSRTLYGGVQLIRPGEVAPAHRHSQAAIRFILEGAGAYAAIDGERVRLAPGDFLINPRMEWHDHGHEGSEPVFWLDALDNPLVKAFEAEFREWGRTPTQEASHPSGLSEAMFGNNLAPVGYRARRLQSPLKRYAYARARESLAMMAKAGKVDPHHAVKLTYLNPTTGGPVLPTIGAHIQWIPAGFTTQPIASTETAIVCAFEGRGIATVGEQRFPLSERDLFLAPSWQPLSIAAESEMVLFSVSNRAALEALGLFFEEKLPA